MSFFRLQTNPRDEMQQTVITHFQCLLFFFFFCAGSQPLAIPGDRWEVTEGEVCSVRSARLTLAHSAGLSTGMLLAWCGVGLPRPLTGWMWARPPWGGQGGNRDTQAAPNALLRMQSWSCFWAQGLFLLVGLNHLVSESGSLVEIQLPRPRCQQRSEMKSGIRLVFVTVTGLPEGSDAYAAVRITDFSPRKAEDWSN